MDIKDILLKIENGNIDIENTIKKSIGAGFLEGDEIFDFGGDDFEEKLNNEGIYIALTSIPRLVMDDNIDLDFSNDLDIKESFAKAYKCDLDNYNLIYNIDSLGYKIKRINDELKVYIGANVSYNDDSDIYCLNEFKVFNFNADDYFFDLNNEEIHKIFFKIYDMGVWK